MGCSKCNKKNNIKGDNESDVKLVSDEVLDGEYSNLNLPLKIIATAIIVVALPLVVVALAMQLIFHMFTPKWYNRMRIKFSKWTKGNLRKFQERNVVKRNSLQREKRSKQFVNNPSYTAESFEDIEVSENNEDNVKN